MSRSRKLICLLLALTIPGVIWFFCFPDTEPRYEGKTISEWVELWCQRLPASVNYLERDKQMRAMCRKMGADAVPSFVKILRTRDPAWKRIYLRILSKMPGPWVMTHLPLVSLGDRREVAASALGAMGPNAKSAVPVLIEQLKDEDADVRNNSMIALTQIEGYPDWLLEIFLPLAKDSYGILKMNVCLNLTEGSLEFCEKRALPELQSNLRDPDSQVQETAKRAIEFIQKRKTQSTAPLAK